MRNPHDTCLEIENHLPLWAGGDLEADVQASVESHLALCEGCARSAARARAARAALEQGLRLESEHMGAGRDPWPTIRAALRADGRVGTPDMTPIARPSFRRWSRAWPVAAALLVGLFLAGTWLPSGSEPTPVPALARQTEPRNPVQRGPVEAPPPAVAIPASLRRLSPADPRMRDTAWLFRPTASPDAGGSVEAQEGSKVSPASFERVQLLPPR